MSIKKAIFTNTIITTITYELTEFGRWDCNALDKAVWKIKLIINTNPKNNHDVIIIFFILDDLHCWGRVFDAVCGRLNDCGVIGLA